MVLSTKRLVLREFTESDAGLLFQLNNDPDIIRFTHDQLNTIAEAQQVLKTSILPQYQLYKLGRWAVFLKDAAHFIGYCGLKYRPALNETDLGYRFLKPYWGMGYAKEAAMACVDYGFEQLGLAEITARAEPANLASIRVLEFCGFSYTGEDRVDGQPVKAFLKENPTKSGLNRKNNHSSFCSSLTFPKCFVFPQMSLYLIYEN